MPLAYEKSINVPALIITIVVAKRISSEKLSYGKIRLVVSKSITIIANIIARVDNLQIKKHPVFSDLIQT